MAAVCVARKCRVLVVVIALSFGLFVAVGHVMNQRELVGDSGELDIIPERVNRELNARHTFQEVFITTSELRENFIIPPPKYKVPLDLQRPWIADPSQLEQAYWIQEILGNIRNGFFIECGAFDGEGLSNTLVLERYHNWTGLLIEADPINFENIMARKRHVFASNTCLSVVKYPTMVSFFQMNVVGKITDHRLGDDLEHHTKATCFPLYMYLEALNKTTVDYFSLDVEGSELEVLKTIPWDRLNIRTLSVEYTHGRGQGGKEAMRAFMEENGYYVYGELPYGKGSGSDFLFVKLTD